MATSAQYTLGMTLSLLAASSTFAAEPVLPRPEFPANIVSGPGYGYGSLNGGGTTARESISRGRGFLIRSVGERHLLDAEAQRSLEEAIDRRLDNILKADQLRLERERTGKAGQQRRFAELQSRREIRMALNRADKMISTGEQTTGKLKEQSAVARLRLAKSLLARGNRAAAARVYQQAEAMLAQATPAAKATQ